MTVIDVEDTRAAKLREGDLLHNSKLDDMGYKTWWLNKSLKKKKVLQKIKHTLNYLHTQFTYLSTGFS